MPGIAPRPNPLEHHHAVGVDVEIGVVDALVIVLDALEDNGLPTMLHQRRRGGGRFDHRAIRAEIAAEDSDA